jgi:hypothetical protein
MIDREISLLDPAYNPNVSSGHFFEARAIHSCLSRYRFSRFEIIPAGDDSRAFIIPRDPFPSIFSRNNGSCGHPAVSLSRLH